jgi:hypothetical protein
MERFIRRMTGACLLRVREANKSSLKVGTCKGEEKSVNA